MVSTLKQFRRWSLDRSDEGPIYLGYRLGHIKGESRVFRALVYNKGALVLHMLRRFVGDEPFFAGLRRYYKERRFKKAGTDDLRAAMEAESGRGLSRFFERWVFDSGIPRVRYSTTMNGEGVTVRLEQFGEVSMVAFPPEPEDLVAGVEAAGAKPIPTGASE